MRRGIWVNEYVYIHTYIIDGIRKATSLFLQVIMPSTGQLSGVGCKRILVLYACHVAV
jgi:hypothetical protein